MSIDLEKIKNAKGRTYINSESCPIPICVEDYLEYKNIEKDLGIDLTTLLKAFKDGIYIKRQNMFKELYVYYEKVPVASFVYYLKAIYVEEECEYQYEYLLSDYGKTWALTREELE